MSDQKSEEFAETSKKITKAVGHVVSLEKEKLLVRDLNHLQ